VLAGSFCTGEDITEEESARNDSVNCDFVRFADDVVPFHLENSGLRLFATILEKARPIRSIDLIRIAEAFSACDVFVVKHCTSNCQNDECHSIRMKADNCVSRVSRLRH